MNLRCQPTMETPPLIPLPEKNCWLLAWNLTRVVLIRALPYFSVKKPPVPLKKKTPTKRSWLQMLFINLYTELHVTCLVHYLTWSNSVFPLCGDTELQARVIPQHLLRL